MDPEQFRLFPMGSQQAVALKVEMTCTVTFLGQQRYPLTSLPIHRHKRAQSLQNSGQPYAIEACPYELRKMVVLNFV